MESYEPVVFFAGVVLGFFGAIFGFFILFWVRVYKFIKINMGLHHARRRLFSKISHDHVKKEASKAEILEILRDSGKVTYSVVEQTLGINHEAAHTCLMELEDEGRINVYIKSGRPVYYVLS